MSTASEIPPISAPAPYLHVFVSNGWQKLTQWPKSGNCCGDFLDILKRIALFVPLVFATLADMLCQKIGCYAISQPTPLSIMKKLRSDLENPAAAKEQPTPSLSSSQQQALTAPARQPAPNQVTKAMEQQFLISAAEGNLDAVRRLLDQGVDPRIRLDPQEAHHISLPSWRFVRWDMTALHLACINGHKAVAAELLQRARHLQLSILDAPSSMGSPLHVTCTDFIENRMACLALLLKEDAALSSTSTFVDYSVIHLMIHRMDEPNYLCHVNGLRLLIEHFSKLKIEVDSFLIENLIKDLVPIINSYGSCLDIINAEAMFKWTPLWLVLIYANFSNEAESRAIDQIVEMLLQAGANPLFTINAPSSPMDAQYQENPIQFMQKTHGNNPRAQPIIQRLQQAAAQWL